MADKEKPPGAVDPDRVLGEIEKVSALSDKAEKLSNRLAATWKKGLIPRLLLVWATLIIVMNPMSAKWFAGICNVAIPSGYSIGFATIFSLSFASLVWLTIIRSKEAKPELPTTTRRAIKGLAAFSEKDAELFEKLHRQDKIRECCEALTDPDFNFRIGILVGVSGAGKSSLINAGLRPRLLKDGVRCFVIKLTQQDPSESIKANLRSQLGTDCNVDGQVSLADFLEACFPPGSATAILIVDQFEQFFVHRKPGAERQPFVEAIRGWFERRERLPVRILLCVREEFSDPLYSIFGKLDQPITRGNRFDLEKFDADEARQVLQTIAETEQIEAESKCIAHIVETLKSDKDDLVKPVDLQMVAESIWRSKGATRKFTMSAVQKLGGVEGLRREYLEQILFPLKPQARREQALHVLLALTEGPARAGVLSVPQLQEKLKFIVPADAVKEAVDFLAHPDNKLISAVEGSEGYELTHESLIPSIQKLVDQGLSGMAQARRLLNKRTNEWLGNERARRFLLPWREWREVRRYPGLTQQADQAAAAQQLLDRSARRFRWYAASATSVLLLLACGSLWWYSTAGYRYRLRSEMISELANVEDPSEAETGTAIALFALGNPSQGCTFLRDGEGRAKFVEVLSELIEAKFSALATNNPFPTDSTLVSPIKGTPTPTAAQLAALLEKVAQIAGLIDDPDERASALSSVAESAGRAGEAAKDKALLEQAAQIAGLITNASSRASALSSVAESAGRAGEAAKAKAWLEQAAQIAGKFDDPDKKASALSSVAQAAGRAGEAAKAKAWLEQAAQIAGKIDDPDERARALSNVAESAGRAGEAAKDKALLEQAAQIAGLITNASSRASALSSVAESAGRSGEAAKAKDWLEQAAQIAGKIDDPDARANALSTVAMAAASVGVSPVCNKVLQDLCQLRPRSGNSLQGGIIAAATVGRLDLSYRLIHRIGAGEQRWKLTHHVLMLSVRDHSWLAAELGRRLKDETDLVSAPWAKLRSRRSGL